MVAVFYYNARSIAARKTFPPMLRIFAACALHLRMQMRQALVGLPRHKCRHCCQQRSRSVLTSKIARCVEGMRVAENATACGAHCGGALIRIKQATTF